MPFVPVTGLQEERGDRAGALELDRLVQVGERGFGVVLWPLRAVVRIQHVHDAGHGGLVRPAAWVTGKRHHPGGRP
jgi:hypothetical protein